ncbi:MAG: TRAP transporter large permease subunit [Chloroflexi bacterium]|nr:TRAP transporter large permease subunit [Chloroflexota bacterium]
MPCCCGGGGNGLRILGLSIYESLNQFAWLPMCLFILMGTLLFHSGEAPLMIEALDKWLGRLPGRLGLLAVAAGVLLSVLTGSTTASTAILGKSLVPQLERRGYKKSMSLGPILGSGGLAMMIPPSSITIVLGIIANISISSLLVASIIPGLLMAFLFAGYIIIRCKLQPSLAPSYDVPPYPLPEKIISTVKYVFPAGIILFLVVGIIFIGVATPSEAAATGTIGVFVLAACYKKLNWKVAKTSIREAVEISVMILVIVSSAQVFSQLLAYTGVSGELNRFLTVDTSLPPIAIIIFMQAVLILMGMFMPSGAIIMIAAPLFTPIAVSLGYNPVWFGALFLLNLEMGTLTPPYGVGLFVMKSVAPPGTTMKDCITASLPFLYLDVVAMALIMIFPAIALWLPGVMR